MIEIQVNALKKKIKALRRRGKALHEDTSLKKANTDAAFAEYAKVTCRELSDLVYKKLPREIRDVIYGHILDCNEILITSDLAKKGDEFKYFDVKYDTYLRNRLFWNLDLWWDSDFVGSKMVRELGEDLYRSASFYFENAFHLISKFRITDQWNLGFLPVSFISNVDVCVSCEDYQLVPWIKQANEKVSPDREFKV